MNRYDDDRNSLVLYLVLYSDDPDTRVEKATLHLIKSRLHEKLTAELSIIVEVRRITMRQ